jgi:hypothetical protein
MRYAKGSFVITPGKDIPLLRHVRNCRFVSHHQLFELLRYDAVESCRSSFNWRIQRLLKTRHLERVEGVTLQGSSVYSVTQDGLLELECQGEFAIALQSRNRRRPDRSRVFHALELNAIRLSLAHAALLASWRSDVEISSMNMVCGAYQKDYDAVVGIWVGNEIREFALEYERSLKSTMRYEKIRASLEAEHQIEYVLYLAANTDLLLALVDHLTPIAKRVGFATARSFREQLLTAPICWDANMVPLGEFLLNSHPSIGGR